MTNHPHRRQNFEITAYHDGREIDPWFIEIDTGVHNWPALRFPFVARPHPGTDEGQRTIERARRAALKAARAYYRHDDTGSFSPRAWLLDSRQNVLHELAAD